MGDPAAPTGDPHCLPPKPPSRLSLGLRKARSPGSRKFCSPSMGQTSDHNSEGSNHDYLPLVRTREVEGGVVRPLSQLTSPPTSSLLRYGCRKPLAPSAWMHPSAQRCASHRSVCAVPHLLLRTAPASAPPQPHLPGHFWDLVSAKATVPWPPTANLPAQAPRVQAKRTVGGAQTPRPQRGQMAWEVLTCGAGPGPQPWHSRGWSTAVPLPSASGN